ncbi:MAG: hypothetical protein CV087_23460 [Candidatus Brocadia sp. WS118]|nr:MAG: hypothetical protein CV087_23460 [Candidatus Brocadia sp. WS118]
MAIDLFGMVLSGAVSWGVGKILDVVITCDYCTEEFEEQIANVQENYLGCPNCYTEIVQYTNACDFTVDNDGRIGHISAKFLRSFSEGWDPIDDYEHYPDWLFFDAAMRAIAMQDKQIVLSGQISDYNSGIIYTSNDSICTAESFDTVWYDDLRIPLNWTDIPEEVRDYRIFAIDLFVKSRYGDILNTDRFLTQFEGWR